MLLDWVARRRPFLTAVIVVLPAVLIVAAGRQPFDLLEPRPSPAFICLWMLLVTGAAIRIWGAGNLRKNEEITSTGVYRMVRHPLYTGSLAILLAYLIAAAGAAIGTLLFAALAVVFYGAIRAEEAHLARAFPHEAEPYRRRPRLLPDLRRLPEALHSDRFTWSMARRNLGLRSLWMIALIPLALHLLGRVAEGS